MTSLENDKDLCKTDRTLVQCSLLEYTMASVPMRFRVYKHTTQFFSDHSLGIELQYKNKAFCTRVNRVFTILHNPTSEARSVFVLIDAKVKIYSSEPETQAPMPCDSDDDRDDAEEPMKEIEDDVEVVEDTWNRVQVEYVDIVPGNTSSDVWFPYWISLERPRQSSSYLLSVMQVLNGKFVLESISVKCEDAVEMLDCFERSVRRYTSDASYVKHLREFEVEGFVDCDRRTVTLSATEFQLAAVVGGARA